MTSLIKKLKDYEAPPFEVEQLRIEGLDLDNIYYIILEKVLGEVAFNYFYFMDKEDIKNEILKTYYPEIPELPEEIAETVEYVRIIYNMEGWALIQDWLCHIDETDEDDIMIDYIDGDIDKALEVYGYILNLEIEEYETVRQMMIAEKELRKLRDQF